MSIESHNKRFSFTSLLYTFLVAYLFCMLSASAVQNEPDNADRILKQAYGIRSASPSEAKRLLDALDRDSLTSYQKDRFDYLRAFEKYINNDFEGAIDDLHRLSHNASSLDHTLLAKSFALALNSGIQRWNDAFNLLDEIAPQVNTIKSKEVQENVHIAMMNFYLQINEHELNTKYIEPLLNQDYSLRFGCNARLQYLNAMVENDLDKLNAQRFEQAIEYCKDLDEPIINLALFGMFARYYYYVQEFDKALQILDDKLPEVERLVYKRVAAEFYELKSLISLATDELENAKFFSQLIIDDAKAEDLSISIISAHKTLYEAEKRLGNFQTALLHHENYLKALSRNIDKENAKRVAIQKAKHNVEEKLVQIALLDKENSLLSTKALLSEKTADNRMLVIALMTVSLVFIGVWVYQRHKHFAYLRDISVRDSLTNIANRRYFTDHASEAISHAKTQAIPISLVVFDIDNFKHINDTYGHLEGDNAIKLCVKAVQRSLRSNDLIGRLGGEEFGILLERVDLTQAFDIAEQCRKEIIRAAQEEACDYSLSASFGVACSTITDCEYSALFERADKMLYRAKNTGKNKVKS